MKFLNQLIYKHTCQLISVLKFKIKVLHVHEVFDTEKKTLRNSDALLFTIYVALNKESCFAWLSLSCFDKSVNLSVCHYNV